MKARKPSTILMALILSFAMSFGMPLTALAEEAPENLDLDAQNIDISDDVNIEDEISNDVSTDDANSSDNALSDANLNADNSNDVNSNEDNADDNISTDVNINDENTLSDANIKDGEQNSANTDDADDNSTTDVIVNGDANLSYTGSAQTSAGNDNPPSGSGEAGKTEIDPENIDAEKYSNKDADEGYDTLLCWAATAANMLWTTEYAQHAINPFTNESFQNEDEVFDYFRKCFQDNNGSPDGAITYFTEGTYEFTGDKDFSQIREDSPGGALLPNSLGPDSLKVEEAKDESILALIGDMVDKAAGALLKWWTGVKFDDGAHWLTVQSLEWSDESYTGIWLADSDSDPATDAGLVGNTPEDKAALAKDRPNVYTYFPLSLETIDGEKLWRVVGYPTDGNTQAIITFICTLSKYGSYVPVVPVPAPEPEPESSTTYYEEPQSVEVPQSTEQAPAPMEYEEQIKRAIALSGDHEALIKLTKEIMLNNGRRVLSLTNGVFDREKDVEFRLFVLNSATILNNVYLDGQRLGLNQYTIVNNPNGTFEIVLGSELLKTLENGYHSFKLELVSNEINTFIVVQ